MPRRPLYWEKSELWLDHVAAKLRSEGTICTYRRALAWAFRYAERGTCQQIRRNGPGRTSTGSIRRRGRGQGPILYSEKLAKGRFPTCRGLRAALHPSHPAQDIRARTMATGMPLGDDTTALRALGPRYDHPLSRHQGLGPRRGDCAILSENVPEGAWPAMTCPLISFSYLRQLASASRYVLHARTIAGVFSAL